MDIQITDKIEKDTVPEDVQVSIITDAIEVPQPPKIVTTKSIDLEINSLQSQIGLMEAELDTRRTLIQEKKDLRNQVETKVSEAIAEALSSAKVVPSEIVSL